MLKQPAHLGNTGTLLHPQPFLRTAHSGHLKRLIRSSAIVAGGAMMLSVAGQLVYPAHTSMPRASFGGINLYTDSRDEINTKLHEIDAKVFTAKTDTKSYAQSLGDIGISLDADKIAEDLSDYPLQQRLLPFSLFFYEPTVSNDHFVVSDQKKLDAFAARIAAENNTVPVEGSVISKDGEITVTHSRAGRDYRAEDIAAYFAAYSHESLKSEAYLPYSSVSPVNSHQHLETIADEARELAVATIQVTEGVHTFKVQSAAVADAFRFTTGADKKVALSLDPSALAAGLEDAADGVFVAPTVSSAGQELDRQATAEVLAAQIAAGKKTAAATLKPLTPTAAKTYAATSKGLQLLIDDWVASHASLEPSVAFSEIAGYNRKAGRDADVSYFSASVYKVFPAWYVLKQIDEGKLNADGIIAGGFNLTDCFQNMIIVSDSKCSEAIVNKYGGWGPMDELARDNGIQGITLSSGVTITANGMTGFLQKLDAGQLLSTERTNYLLDAMKRQKYRTGIPAGSAGEVADKVGYQPKTYSWHDAGIVYHPKGKYTLVILTHKGATLPALATLARQISDTLNR